MQNNDLCMFKSEQFVFVPETNDFVCITTSQNLNFKSKQIEFFEDGILYFFLPNKTKQI